MSNKDKDLTYYIENVLYPALFERIDLAFSDMDFKRTKGGNRWISHKHIDGSPSKGGSKDQTVITLNPGKPLGILDNGTRESLTLIRFEERRSGLERKEAINRLASIAGVFPFNFSNADPERIKLEMKEQDDRQQDAEQMIEDLWNTEDGAYVRKYFIDERGWSEKELKASGIGYHNHLKKYRSFSNIPPAYKIAIPFRTGSRITGFKFRVVKEVEGLKKFKNTTGEGLKQGCFLMSLRDKDITIVESELDAIRAQVNGFSGFVATAGGSLTVDQLEDIKAKGVKRITLLFDNDEGGRGFIKQSLELIRNHSDIRVFVAEFDEEKIKDLDDFISEYGAPSIHNLLDNAMNSYKWSYKQIAKGTTDKEKEDYYNECIKLLSGKTWAVDIDEVKKLMIADGATVTDFETRILKGKEEQVKKDSKERFLSELEEVKGLVLKNEGRKACERLRGLNYFVDSKDLSIFEPLKRDAFERIIKTTNDEIGTGIFFRGKTSGSKIKEEFTISQGITFVCGATGHGKTSFLNNIVLNEAMKNVEEGNNKRVLYFSYEIAKHALIVDLMNLYANIPEIGRNPTRSIKHFIKTGSFDMFERRGKVITEKEHLTTENLFLLKQESFYKNILETGAITVFDECYTVEDMLKTVKMFNDANKDPRTGKSSLPFVCIDYAQLLYSESPARMRTEEIKAIVHQIARFSEHENIPFVLAAQFNREVSSPASVLSKNIGEGGDFERIANTCIGIFNLKELRKTGGSEDKENIELLQEFLTDKDDLLTPRPDKIFIKLMKKRNGFFPLYNVVDWEGKTKRIYNTHVNGDDEERGSQRFEFN